MFSLISRIASRALPKSAFVRAVGVLAGGAGGAQLIALAVAPVLTRLYSPAEFGILAIYAAMAGVLVVVASLRYEGAIPLPESDVEAANIVVLCLLLLVGTTACSVAIVMLAGRPISMLIETPALSRYLWILPFGVFLAGLYQIVHIWTLRKKRFKAITKTRITQSLSAVAIQLAGHKLGPLALIAGHATSQGIGAGTLALAALRDPSFRQVSYAGIVRSAKKHKDFPTFSTWSGLLNVAGNELPAVLFALLFSPAAAGLYALANRVLNMPMNLVGNALANVFFVNAAEAKREDRLAPMVIAVHEKLAHIVMPFAMVLILMGPELFAMAFGERWREAGVFAQWMTPWLYVRFITSPLSALISVLGVQRNGLFFYAALFLTRVAAIVIGSLAADIVLTIALFSMASMLSWAGFLLWITVQSGNSAWSLLRPTATALAWGALCVAPLGVHLLFDAQSMWMPAALAVTVLLVSLHYYRLARHAY